MQPSYTLPSVLNLDLYREEVDRVTNDLSVFINDVNLTDMISMVDITTMDTINPDDINLILAHLDRYKNDLMLQRELPLNEMQQAELNDRMQTLSTVMERLQGRRLFHTYAERGISKMAIHHALQLNSRGNLSYLNLESAKLDDADLSRFNLGHINLRNAHARNVNFKGTTLTRAMMAGAMLELSTFKKSNLYAVDFTAANLRATNFENADCTDAQFIQANLSSSILLNTNMSHANLGSAKLINAILDDTQFVDANLRAANLKNANFRAVNFSGADLSHANLIGTNLAQAQFTGATLDHAVFIDPAMFRLNHLENLMQRLNQLGEMLEFHPDKALLKRAISTNVIDLLDGLAPSQEKEVLTRAIYHHRIFQHTHSVVRSINRFSAILSRSASGYLESPEQNMLSEYKRRSN